MVKARELRADIRLFNEKLFPKEVLWKEAD